MRLNEVVSNFFTGEPKIKEAREVIRVFGDKGNLNKTDQRRLDKARDESKRLFLRQVVIGGVAVIGGSVIASLGLNELFPRRESDDEIREGYENAFIKLAAGDPHGEDLVNFYAEFARKGHFEGETRVSDDKRSVLVGRDFLVAVVDPEQDSLVLLQSTDAVSYISDKGVLVVRKLKLADEWKGAIFAYGVSNAHDSLVGGVELTDGEFYSREVKAYELTLRLLDSATKGQLKEKMRTQARMIPKGEMITGFSVESFSDLDSLFPEPKSIEEAKIRAGIYNIGTNITLIELKYPHEEVALQKMKYVSLFSRPDVQNFPLR